eukprot:2808397-Pleurochrysis_carterae.AAC.1
MTGFRAYDAQFGGCHLPTMPWGGMMPSISSMPQPAHAAEPSDRMRREAIEARIEYDRARARYEMTSVNQ